MFIYLFIICMNSLSCIASDDISVHLSTYILKNNVRSKLSEDFHTVSKNMSLTHWEKTLITNLGNGTLTLLNPRLLFSTDTKKIEPYEAISPQYTHDTIETLMKRMGFENFVDMRFVFELHPLEQE